MAKRINDQWVPGVIYELRCFLDNEWHPFYVGESIDAQRRLSEHKQSGKGDLRDVYNFIRQLNNCQVIWDLFVVATYGKEGPSDLEDQYVIDAIMRGYKLKNMKRGNANWLSEREKIAKEMQKHNFTTLKQYKDWQSELVNKEVRAPLKNVLTGMQLVIEQANAQRIEKEQKQKARKAKQEAAIKAIRAEQEASWNNLFKED